MINSSKQTQSVELVVWFVTNILKRWNELESQMPTSLVEYLFTFLIETIYNITNC